MKLKIIISGSLAFAMTMFSLCCDSSNALAMKGAGSQDKRELGSCVNSTFKSNSQPTKSRITPDIIEKIHKMMEGPCCDRGQLTLSSILIDGVIYTGPFVMENGILSGPEFSYNVTGPSAGVQLNCGSCLSSFRKSTPTSSLLSGW